MQSESRKILEKLDILIPSLRNRASAPSPAASARRWLSPVHLLGRKFLIMDEPTAALGVAEQRKSSTRSTCLKSPRHRHHCDQPPDA